MAKLEQQAQPGGQDLPGRKIALVADRDVTDAIADRLKDRFGADTHIVLVAPALVKSRFDHMAGNADGARVEAEARLEESKPALEHAGLEPDEAAVGDQDPVIAVEDLLREFGDLDEVVLLNHSGDDQRWAEHDAFDRLRQRVGVPVTVLEVSDSGELVDTDHSEPGTDASEDTEVEPESRNLPDFSLKDFLAVVVAIVGTIVLGVIAAQNISEADNAGAGLETGDLIAALLAVSFFLINVWHIVAIFFFESVGYRGIGAKVFADVSLFGTPLAILIALLVT